jgi:hypothetical protein
MKRVVNTKFYTFNQNNSGGCFVADKKRGISEFVIIEALNADDANTRAENIGIYFNGCEDGNDCPCCGDRWYQVSESDAEKIPSLYGKPVEEAEAGWSRKDVFIHYMDGKIKEVLLKEPIQTEK